MEKTSTLINTIYSESNEYVKLQAKSLKLEIYERITNVIESGISAAIIIVFGLFSFLFVNFGLAFWLSEIFGSTKAGFFVVGAFYFVVLGVYLLLKDRVAKNKVKNIVLLKVSKTHDDFDLLLQEQEIVHAQVQKSEEAIVGSFKELKENIETIKEDITRLKEQFITGEGEDNTDEKVGPKIPRVAITTLVDLVLQKVVFRKAGLVKKTLLPILTNALLTSTVFKASKKTSLVENLKLKFSKFF